MPHLLIVEDDVIIGENLRDAFSEGYDFQVTWLKHGDTTQESLVTHTFET